MEFSEGFPISYLKYRDSANNGITRGLEVLGMGNIGGFIVMLFTTLGGWICLVVQRLW